MRKRGEPCMSTTLRQMTSQRPMDPRGLRERAGHGVTALPIVRFQGGRQRYEK